MKRPIIPAVVLLGACVWIAPVSGQQVPDEPEKAVRELAGIQRSLDDLVGLLATMRKNQDANLVLRRIELHERRLAPLARRLESNKQEQVNTKTNISEARDWVIRVEDEIDAVEREGLEEVPADIRQQIVIGEAEIERLTRRLDALQERQIELEDRLADGRDEVEILDELLQELLQ